MTVLVAIPFWHAGPYIERAVRSVLAQTDRDLVVLVCGDGEVPEVGIHDDRLVVHAFKAWHGAPFVQQAMLLGSPFEFYAPFGADDWADADHLELARSIGPNVAAGALWWHIGDSPRPARVWNHGGRKLYEVGRYRTEDMRAVGGYGAQEQCSQDVLMLGLMARLGLRRTDRPTYHRVRRPDSLTTRPDTGIHSPLRSQIRHRNRLILAHCQGRALTHVRRYRERLLPDGLRTELADCVGEIERALA